MYFMLEWTIVKRISLTSDGTYIHKDTYKVPIQEEDLSTHTDT